MIERVPLFRFHSVLRLFVAAALLAALLVGGAPAFAQDTASPAVANDSQTTKTPGALGTPGAPGTPAPPSSLTKIIPAVPVPTPNTGQVPVTATGPASTGLPHPHPAVVPVPIILNAPDTTQYCLPGGVAMCNTMVAIPSQVPLGATVTLAVPAPYKHQPFTVTCVENAGVLTYQITDESEVTCAPQTCGPQSLNVCGNPVDVQGGTKVGESITVDVPPTKLTDPVYGAEHFQAVCGDNGGTEPTYKLSDTSALNCNGFTCPDTSIRLCDTDIPVKGGAHMGEVKQMTMPAPFMPDGFAVECLGTEGKPPIYQTVDVMNVTCVKSPE